MKRLIILILLFTNVLLSTIAYAVDQGSINNETSLFYFEKVNDHYNWTVHNLDQNKKHIFHTTQSRPADLVWDFRKKELFYLENNEVCSFGWSKEKQLTRIGKLSEEYRFPQLVINQGRVMVIALIDSGITTSEVGGKTYFKYGNKTFDASLLTPEGMPAIALAIELANGRANVIKQTPTRCGAGDTPCLWYMLQEFAMDDQAISMSNLLDRCSFRGLRNKEEDREKFLKLNSAQFRELLVKLKIQSQATDYNMLGSEAPVLIEISKDKNLLLKTIFGDTRHFAPPLYFCSDRISDLTEVNLPSSLNQLAIANNGEYLIIANEYYNNQACLFKLGNPNPFLILKNTENVVFAPFDNFWNEFSELSVEGIKP